jgi:hypothetical protein
MTSSRYIAVIEESQIGSARRCVAEICKRSPDLARLNGFRMDSRCLVSPGVEPWFGYGCALLTLAPHHMLLYWRQISRPSWSLPFTK